MLSAFGLQRLESVIHDDHLAAGGIVAGIEHTARATGEIAVPLPVPLLSDFATLIEPGFCLLADEPGLPTRPNQLFQPTALANRV